MDNEAALVAEITEYAKGGKVECPSCGEYNEVVLARDTSVVSREFWRFRVRHARQCKAWSAGNIGHIGKDQNAAVARMASSRRARPTGPVAALHPLAMGPPFPAGTRLATDPVGRAEVPELA